MVDHFGLWFQQYGLAAVFVLLLLENFGLPLPGEAVLLYAGYQMRAHAGAGWGWPELFVSASAACIAGEAAGYLLGRSGGAWARRILRLSGRHRAVAEAYFQQHGPVTIVLARFVAGLRFLAGPIAGLYQMPWRAFMIYNVVGAVAWVALVSLAGVLLGVHGPRLAAWLGRADAVTLIVAAVLIALAWRQLRRRLQAGSPEGGSHE